MTPHNTLHTNMSLIGYIHNWVYVFFKKKIGKVLPNFDLYKGFFLEKMTQIHLVLKKEKSDLPDFYDKFH